jgi:hypothetical protein
MARYRSQVYQIRLTPEEKRRWEEGAWRSRRSLAALIRDGVEAELTTRKQTPELSKTSAGASGIEETLQKLREFGVAS